MGWENHTIQVWKPKAFGGRYWLPFELGFVALFKPTMFALGIEVIKNGVMLFIGPLAIGVGTAKDDAPTTPEGD